MTLHTQKDRAARFQQFHIGGLPLILPNIWDSASASIFEQAGFQALATTSSGVAAALGYPDGQQISRGMLIETVTRITRVIECPLSVDLEAGYGDTIEDVLETVKDIIVAGAVGINIEDSTKQATKALVDVSFQVDLLTAIRELALSLDIPLLINARTDVFLLLRDGEPVARFEEAVRRARAYRNAGADCLFFIGVSDADTIAKLVQAVNGPVNVIASPATPTVQELAHLGVRRISFASGLMRATLAHLRLIAHELLEQGTYTTMSEIISSAELQQLFENKALQ